MICMADNENKPEELSRLAETMVEVGVQGQRMMAEFLARHTERMAAEGVDPLDLGGAFSKFAAQMMSTPERLIAAELALFDQQMALWRYAFERFAGKEAPPVAAPAAGDRRFRDAAWQELVAFDFIKQSYLLAAKWLMQVVRETKGLDDQTAKKVDFYTRQFVDAVSPANFLLTNPEALRTTMESGGRNLLQGLRHIIADLEQGGGDLKIRMTDDKAFRVGENLATAPGAVVFQNRLMQLIQYAPTTEQVHKHPLVIVPPWINKYYILDLKPENSLIRWAVAQGYTVFVISWVNPDESHAEITFGDYMHEGILAALDAIERAIGEKEVMALGYCIGGTLLATTLAYMAATDDRRIRAATFLASQVDFTEAGELQIMIDDASLDYIDDLMSKKGYLDGGQMSGTFNMLRANDLIWSFVVNNYLLGREPPPFDLLYWNSDATRMPAEMHRFYLRAMYKQNKLVEPGGIVLSNVPIDLRRITVPCYVQAAKEDHIAPARSVYKIVHLLQGPVRFVLAGSGHVAGAINPPAQKKYQHWVGAAGKFPLSVEEWLAAAKEVSGSWWPDWERWMARRAGAMVAARQPGAGAFPAIEPAPGSYVKVRVA